MRKKTSGEQPGAAESGKELGKPKRRSSLSASFRLPSVRLFHCNSKFQKNKTQNRRLVTTRQRQELYSLNQLMTRLEKEAFARVGSQLWSHLTIRILDIRYNDFLNKSPSSCRFVRSEVTAKARYNAFVHLAQFLSFSLPLPSNHQPSNDQQPIITLDTWSQPLNHKGDKLCGGNFYNGRCQKPNEGCKRSLPIYMGPQKGTTENYHESLLKWLLINWTVCFITQSLKCIYEI